MAQTLSAVRFLHSFLIKKRTTKWRKHRTPKRKLDISTSFAHAHNRPFIHNLWRKFRSVLEVNDFQPFSVFLLNFHNYSLSPPNFTHGRNTIVLTMLSVYGLFLFDSTVQFRNPQNWTESSTLKCSSTQFWMLSNLLRFSSTLTNLFRHSSFLQFYYYTQTLFKLYFLYTLLLYCICLLRILY